METAPRPGHRHSRRLPLLLAAPLLTAVALTGCGAHSGQTSPDAAGSVAREPGLQSAAGSTGKATDTVHGYAAEGQPSSEVQQRAVISTGAIELTSSDLVTTR